jgi:hypothetical protein
MIDHYIDNNGTFPDFQYLKNEIGHKLMVLYERSQLLIARRSIHLNHLQELSDPIHQAVLQVLHNFAEGDRYSNINLLIGSRRSGDPIAAWFNNVDLALLDARVSERKRTSIAQNAAEVATLLDTHARVLHTAETGAEITGLEEASQRTGIFEAVAPYRQLYVLQIIRYWVELLAELEHAARSLGTEDIPFFGELMAAFRHDDSYIRTRKTWEGL